MELLALPPTAGTHRPALGILEFSRPHLQVMRHIGGEAHRQSPETGVTGGLDVD